MHISGRHQWLSTDIDNYRCEMPRGSCLRDQPAKGSLNYANKFCVLQTYVEPFNVKYMFLAATTI